MLEHKHNQVIGISLRRITAASLHSVRKEFLMTQTGKDANGGLPLVISGNERDAEAGNQENGHFRTESTLVAVGILEGHVLGGKVSFIVDQ